MDTAHTHTDFSQSLWQSEFPVCDRIRAADDGYGCHCGIAVWRRREGWPAAAEGGPARPGAGWPAACGCGAGARA